MKRRKVAGVLAVAVACAALLVLARRFDDRHDGMWFSSPRYEVRPVDLSILAAFFGAQLPPSATIEEVEFNVPAPLSLGFGPGSAETVAANYRLRCTAEEAAFLTAPEVFREARQDDSDVQHKLRRASRLIDQHPLFERIVLFPERSPGQTIRYFLLPHGSGEYFLGAVILVQETPSSDVTLFVATTPDFHPDPWWRDPPARLLVPKRSK